MMHQNYPIKMKKYVEKLSLLVVKILKFEWEDSGLLMIKLLMNFDRSWSILKLKFELNLGSKFCDMALLSNKNEKIWAKIALVGCGDLKIEMWWFWLINVKIAQEFLNILLNWIIEFEN